MADRTNRESATLVIGIGRFGAALAITLDRMGKDVLAVDTSPRRVEQWAGRIPVIEADASNPDALAQIGADEFPTAVVGVASSIEASVLITGNLVDLGTPQIWAKAISGEHGRILRRIGAHHVVYPEADAGQRVAHMVSGRMLDYIEMEDGFTIVKMRPPKETHGFTIAESQIQRKYGITIIGVKSPGEPFEYATAETRINPFDTLIVSGDTKLLDRFAQRP
ncbi:MAG TPA: TrkA family potassium uptake protein [Actinomycetaceae bacterium]|nr:TrkA family potassium uptake protein [Actinomycetaceae bacterium]